jgi:hypothetical protein
VFEERERIMRASAGGAIADVSLFVAAASSRSLASRLP